MAKLESTVLDHLEWLGYVQPDGLVVSATALNRQGAYLNRQDAEGQRLLQSVVEERVFDSVEGSALYAPDFAEFARTVLGWGFSPKAFAGMPEHPIPEELQLPLPEQRTIVAPRFAVREPEPEAPSEPWQLLVREVDVGVDLDEVRRSGNSLEVSPHVELERLLRHTGVRAGLLFNGRTLRLVSAPRGESSGWLDFHIADMLKTAGRPICSAMRLLLGQPTLLLLPKPRRLIALLTESRRYQNDVSDRLSEQVLHALYELLRGLQAAHDASHGDLLREPLGRDPNEVYHALLTVILRLVFLLYAEERGLLSEDDAYLQHYSLAGLHQKLQEDAGLNPDTMDQRYGAWAQLLVLFRMVHDGADSGSLRLPQRHGELFDPNRFPFLEGRGRDAQAAESGRVNIPLIPDSTIQRALEYLLVLDGERLSYRALDVEQIGSVYETMMGFRVEVAVGRSIAIRSQKKHGAPTVVDLDTLFTLAPVGRKKWLDERVDRKLTSRVLTDVQAATSVSDLHAALQSTIDVRATPDLVPSGTLVLQPSDERRRSGSHYTPRELTEPIVRTTLDPILARLRQDGQPPRPEQILDLKVCDPAMGSGAFLVETCRYLGDALIESWLAYGQRPEIPPDEDDVVFARRLVAQRCLFGVDRNPVAVDLSKVSLWLATLAKGHPLTFIDHALRHGDSLLGLSRLQIEAFHWKGDAPNVQLGIEAEDTRKQVTKASALRRQIRDSDESVPDGELRDLWDQAQSELIQARLLGDLSLAAFLAGENARARETKRAEFAKAVLYGKSGDHLGWLQEQRDADPPLAPFHWEIEFPEVFERERPGFDAFVGNPPFAGKNSVAAGNVPQYADWLKELHQESHGNSDLVAHFFRRAFTFLRENGTFGLIATNTIAQGDTRASGLRWICTHGGEIYTARRRVKWPGMAAVVVSVVHVMKGPFDGTRWLDERNVDNITAFLFHRGGHDDPARLAANPGKSFVGSYVLGMGFTFDDTDTRGVATPIAEMRRLIEADPRNQEVIFSYIGGEEVNTSPTHAHHRYVINFGERSEEECWKWWPELMAIVEAKVKPERMMNNREGYRRYWWQYGEKRAEMLTAIAGLERVLAISQTSRTVAFTTLPTRTVYSHKLIIFPYSSLSAFCALQCRAHELWARFFGSSMKDDAVYTPSDCFDTFPFPDNWETHLGLETAGRTYYDFRAALMVKNNEGLTKTYNRFHDPEGHNSGIVKLRDLHTDMDRAILAAYGWNDIPTECEFLLDYDIDEEEWGDRRKPWRYRWPNEVSDEVLARLLELNAKRARAQHTVVKAVVSNGDQGRKTTFKSTTDTQGEDSLFS